MVEEFKGVPVKPTHSTKKEKETKKKVPSQIPAKNSCTSIAAKEACKTHTGSKNGDSGFVEKSVESSLPMHNDASKMQRSNCPIHLNVLLVQLSRNQNLSHPQKRFYKKFLKLFLLAFRVPILRWLR